MTYLDIVELWNIKNDKERGDVVGIFDGIVIDERIDKEVMAGVILSECGSMDTPFDTTEVFKYMSDNFFKKYEWNIKKLLDTLEFEYDPIKNKNLEWIETTNIEQNLDTTEATSRDKTRKNTGSQTTKDTGTQGNQWNESREDKISAMNSSSYQPDDTASGSGGNTRTDNLTRERTDNLNEIVDESVGKQKEEGLKWDETDTHKESGVNDVVVQDLIEKERKVAEFNVYTWIANKYAKDLFLLVY